MKNKAKNALTWYWGGIFWKVYHHPDTLNRNITCLDCETPLTFIAFDRDYAQRKPANAEWLCECRWCGAEWRVYSRFHEPKLTRVE